MSAWTKEMEAICRCAAQYRTEMLAPLGLKSCHASYLLAICENPGISQEQLAKRIYFNKSSVARQLTVLEEGGFIRRVTCGSDRRVTQLYPTEKAKEAEPRLQQILAQWETWVTQDLDRTEQDALRTALEKMKSRATQKIRQEAREGV